MTDAGSVTLKEAARLTGVSLSTLRRRRDELRDHGAQQAADGTWSIPVQTLVELGLMDRVTPATTARERRSPAPPDTPPATPHEGPTDTPDNAPDTPPATSPTTTRRRSWWRSLIGR